MGVLMWDIIILGNESRGSCKGVKSLEFVKDTSRFWSFSFDVSSVQIPTEMILRITKVCDLGQREDCQTFPCLLETFCFLPFTWPCASFLEWVDRGRFVHAPTMVPLPLSLQRCISTPTPQPNKEDKANLKQMEVSPAWSSVIWQAICPGNKWLFKCGQPMLSHWFSRVE